MYPGTMSINSLPTQRRRNWNFRRIHLAGYAPDVIGTIEQNPQCALCLTGQQGSPAGATTARGAFSGSSPDPLP